MRTTILTFLFCCSMSFSFAQTDPKPMMKNLFESMQKDDLDAFSGCFLAPRDYSKIMIMLFSSISDKIKPGEGTVASDSLIKKAQGWALESLRKNADSMGVDLSKSTLVNFAYTIVKEPGTFLESLKGAIYFKFNEAYYSFGIDEAVLLDDKWKISAFGRFSAVTDKTFLTDPMPSKLTAFGSLETKTEISVKADHFVPPPPPPSPPPKPKKSGRN